MAANERKKILFVASECVPFIKTGGLADVMDYHWKSEYVGVLKTVKNGITFYFIDNEGFFTTDKPYTDDPLFEITRFAYFSKACLSALQPIGFRPDLIHCHDWQTGLVPVYLKERFADNEFYQGIKTVMTIHNLKFQGKWNVKDVEDITGLSGYYFTPDKLEAYKDANLLKGGLVYADAITTVSPTYAEEIKTQFYGEGLDGLMNARANDLRGILNGIDYTDFSPDNDKKIFKSYTVDDFRRNKVKNKIALQKELGLKQDEKCFMIGIVSRLTDQKGKRDTRTCSAISTGSTTTRSPRTSTIPMNCPTRSMRLPTLS